MRTRTAAAQRRSPDGGTPPSGEGSGVTPIDAQHDQRKDPFPCLVRVQATCWVCSG
jgi:hypothetical protein